MKTLKFLFFFSLLALTACNNDEFYQIQSENEAENSLKSRSLSSVEEIEYPLYHVVYNPTTEMLNITLDPQYTNYNPSNYSYIVMYMEVQTLSGYKQRYSTAFPMKGSCWADMYYALIGNYVVWLELDGVEFNRTTFTIPTPINNHYRDGNLFFQTAPFSN